MDREQRAPAHAQARQGVALRDRFGSPSHARCREGASLLDSPARATVPGRPCLRAMEASRFGQYLLLERTNVGEIAEAFIARQLSGNGAGRIVALKRICLGSPTIAASCRSFSTRRGSACCRSTPASFTCSSWDRSTTSTFSRWSTSRVSAFRAARLPLAGHGDAGGDGSVHRVGV